MSEMVGQSALTTTHRKTYRTGFRISSRNADGKGNIYLSTGI
jgi:hypothetical protein